jgi:hypothetical protein
MSWGGHLQSGERVRWEGRPAPRCFTFRNWRHSLFGMLLLILTSYWQVLGYRLGLGERSPILALIPLPFLLAAIYLSVGHLVLARLEWEKVFYAVTDRRILVRRGVFRIRLEELALSDITWFRLKPLGEELGTLRVHGGGGPYSSLVLHCIEYPGRVTEMLEEVVKYQKKNLLQG